MKKKRQIKNKNTYNSDSIIIKAGQWFLQSKPAKIATAGILIITIGGILLYRPAISTLLHYQLNSKSNELMNNELNPNIKKLNEINKQINSLYAYSSKPSSDYATSIINNSTNKKLSIDDSDMYADIKYDGSIDLVQNKISKETFDPNNAAKYTQSFIKASISTDNISKLKLDWQNIKKLTIPKIKNDSLKSQFKKEIKDYNNTNDLINNLILKFKTEQALNSYTENPVYTTPKVDTKAPISKPISDNDIKSLKNDISDIDKYSDANVLLVDKYTLALKSITDQSAIANSVIQLISKAKSDPSIETIKAVNDQLNKMLDSTLKSTYSDQLKPIQQDFNKKLNEEKAAKAKSDEKAKLKKENDELKKELDKAKQSSSSVASSSDTKNSSTTASFSDNQSQTQTSTTSVIDLSPKASSQGFVSNPSENTTVKLGDTSIIQTNLDITNWQKGQIQTFKLNGANLTKTISDTQDINKSNPTRLSKSDGLIIAKFINNDTLRLYYLD